jgi:hypothetical protein
MARLSQARNKYCKQRFSRAIQDKPMIEHIVYSVKRLNTYYIVGGYLLGEFAKLGVDEEGALKFVSLDIMPDDIRRISTLYSEALSDNIAWPTPEPSNIQRPKRRLTVERLLNG